MTDTTTPAPEGADANELAQSELAANTVPTPEDVLADVGPLATLWYARQTVYYAQQLWAALLSGDEAADLGDTTELAAALEGISIAAGNLDGACIRVSLLPLDYGDSATA